MKRHLLTGVPLLLVGFAAAGSTVETTFDRTFDARAGSLFALSNTNGRIILRAWDEPRIHIYAIKRVESRDSDAAKKALSELRIEPSVTADGVRVNTIYPRKNGGGIFDWLAGLNVSMSVQYDVTVPRSTNLNLDNTNGSIEVSDVHGSHRIGTTNGHIELVRCGGDVDAETTNGAIRAELNEVNSGKSIRLETTNGRITVALPRSVSARVDASTTNGGITTDLPVTTTEMGHHALRGTINGGGAELRLRTTNGSISIEAR